MKSFECGLALFLLFFIVLIHPVSAAVTVESTSFESESDATEGYSDSSGNDWNWYEDFPRTGSHGPHVDGSAYNERYSKNTGIDLTSYYDCTLSVWFRIEGNWDYNEYICLDYSSNGGSSWNRNSGHSGDLCVAQNYGTDDGAYHLISYNLLDPTSVIDFRWRFRAYVTSSSEDGYVDDLTLQCNDIKPTITSVTDSPNLQTAGQDVQFSVDWDDGDEGETVQIHVCKSNSITGSVCDDGSWCDSTGFTADDPVNCNYTTQSSDEGVNDYYAFVCDDYSACSVSESGDFTVVLFVIGDDICESELGENCTNSPDDCNVDYTDCHTCEISGTDCYYPYWDKYYSEGQNCCGSGSQCGTESMSMFTCSAAAGNWTCNDGFEDCDSTGNCRCHTSAGKTICDPTQTLYNQCCGEVVVGEDDAFSYYRNGYWTTDGFGSPKCCSNDNMCINSTGDCVIGSESDGYANCNDGADNDCDGLVDCDDDGCGSSVYCSPQFASFSFDCSIDTINIIWNVAYEGGSSITMNCILNDLPTENCSYIGSPGGGSCYIETPNYDTDQDGTLSRTVQNKLNCTVYDTTDPTYSTEDVANFYPVEFEVSMPSEVALIVGDPSPFVITIKNLGTLTDAYNVEVTTSDSEVLTIVDGMQTTESLQTAYSHQIYTNLILLSSEATASADVKVTSMTYTSIEFDPDGTELIVRGGYKSLPDFGPFGILQVMVFSAAILVSFLF